MYQSDRDGKIDPVGRHIKGVAIVVRYIGIGLSILIGLIILGTARDFTISGLLVMAGGSLVSWLSTLALLGFGELIVSQQ